MSEQPTVTGEQLQEALKKEAAFFNMNAWAWGDAGEYDKPVCGTTMCLAGIACTLAGDKIRIIKIDDAVATFAVDPTGMTHHIGERGAELLGLPDADEGLFHTSDWPESLYHEYLAANTPDERAEVGCRAIGHFLLGEVIEEIEDNDDSDDDDDDDYYDSDSDYDEGDDDDIIF
jgi:hypothetical protein